MPTLDRDTRLARVRVLEQMDALYRVGLSRRGVRRWTAAVLGVGVADAEVAVLTEEQCDRICARIEYVLWKLRGT